jgi:translation initiation factor IF-2
VTQKKRVYDLAKEFGMTGQDLVAKLRELGFSQIKTHMTALSDFEELEIRGKLEAYGVVVESQEEGKVDLGGGLVVRKKKKKKAEGEAEGDAPTLTEEAPAAQESAPAPAPAPLAPVAATRVAEPQAPTPAPAPRVETSAPAPEEPAPLAVAAALAPAPTEDVAPNVTPAAPQPAPIAVAESATAAPTVLPAAAAPVAAETELKPAARKRAGNVVGFIDLTKLAPQQLARKPEARRLRSSDDEAAPVVMPTLGHDKRKALTRGDMAARGQLTAQQLRERENARFLRNKRPGMSGPGGPGGRRGGPSRGSDPSGLSPHSGDHVQVEPPVTVRKLADALSVKPTEILKAANRLLGFNAVNINSLLDEDTAVLLAHEFAVELALVREVEAEEALLSELAQRRAGIEAEHLALRAPCVAFLGHVDHGKTTLIDTIRSSQIARGESGGITQHIGAYQVRTKQGHTLTIIDTPGHAAFTAMRARGAKAVDIVVLVVAADDGVMPQTEEALNHARAAKTLVVVAMNKIDKAGANPDQVKNQLARLELSPEEWGGSTAFMPVSGLTGQGVEELLERVFLESEVLELKCHPKGPAQGVVLEAEVQQGKGRVAHLLVQDGSLRRGDVILAGEGYGKVRSIHNDRGEELEEAGPSMPVEVTGLSELPGVGDHFHVVDNLDQAKDVAEERQRKLRQMSLAERRSISSENLLQAVAEQAKKTINVVVKADVQGSVQVLKGQLAALVHPEVELKLIDAGVGQVSESDVDLAITSNAMVLAFHVSTNSKARVAAERAGVEIRYYEVIYELLDEMRAIMEGSLAPDRVEQITGHLEVRRIFKSSKIGNIAGCYVIDGTIGRDNKCRLLRDGQVIFSGQLGSLRREKDDAKEVREGFECGVTIRDYNDVREGDVIEAFKVVEEKRLLKL